MNNNTILENKNESNQLIKVVEKICDYLRKVMEVNEYRNYVLGFLFYKYLSEKMEKEVNDLLKDEKIQYKDITPENKVYQQIKNFIIQRDLGFFIDYTNSFQNVFQEIQKGNNIIPLIEEAFNQIQSSSRNQESEGDFKDLFQEVALDASKLGKIESERESTIQFIIKELHSLNLVLEQTEDDIFGGAYEYLLSEFASDGGKKAGEFYTPSSISELIARIATHGRDTFKSAYDPACGSGSLLIKLTKKVNSYNKIYGQEIKTSTYNLARMNLFLRGLNFNSFDIKEGDTLINPKHLGEKFECIVANPPFSLKWSADPKLLKDERYNTFGKLAPKSYADFAFLQHMLYQLEPKKGIIVSVFSLGVLERGNAEKQIRQVIVDLNFIDTIIMLPQNIFYNTSIPTCLIIARKNKGTNKDVFFIDATQEFEKSKRQNKLSEENIQKIFETWRDKKEIEYFSKIVSVDEIIENDYSLSANRYIPSKPEEIEVIDIEQLEKEILEYDIQIQELEKQFKTNLENYIKDKK